MQDFDLHMHTTYCDGNDSAEDMVRSAIEKGLKTVGLSGHSFTPHDPSYCMSRENTLKYIDEVRRLKEKYAESINVLLGLELDYYADTDTSPYDYLIGSVHYMFTPEGRAKRDRILASDRIDVLSLTELIKFSDWSDVDDEPFDMRQFALTRGVDMLSVAELFYETEADIIKQTDCDIIGHFDLVTKFNERYRYKEDGTVVDLWKMGKDLPGEAKHQQKAGQMERTEEEALFSFFDTEDERYVKAWKKAVDRIFADCAERCKNGYRNRLEKLGVLEAGDKPVFEINHGAVAKGYRTTPYPAQDQIDYIKSKGGILILSSDSHRVDTIINTLV